MSAMETYTDWLFKIGVALAVVCGITAGIAGLYAIDTDYYNDVDDKCMVREENRNEWFFEDKKTERSAYCTVDWNQIDPEKLAKMERED